MQQKNLYFIILIVGIVVVAGVGFWYWQQQQAPAPPVDLPPAAEKQDGGTTYGTLPEVDSTSNPLENAPDINPINKANPLKDIYNNPFE